MTYPVADPAPDPVLDPKKAGPVAVSFIPSSGSSLRTRVGESSDPEFTFNRGVANVDGVARREIPLAVKGQDAMIAQGCRERLLAKLGAGPGSGRKVTVLDIQYLGVRYEGGTVTRLNMEDADVRNDVMTLRKIYADTAFTKKIPVYWPKFAPTECGDLDGPRSLVHPTDRTRKMSQWTAQKIITSLNIGREEDKKKAEDIEKFTNDMVASLQGQIDQNLPNSEERKKALKALQESFTCADRTAITAAALDVQFDALQTALEAEEGELEEGLRGTVLRRRNTAMTPAEETHLQDIDLLKEKTTEELIRASQDKYGRPPTQDSFERILLQAIESAEGVDDARLNEIVDTFCSHRLVAGIPNLHPEDLDAFKASLKDQLQNHFHG